MPVESVESVERAIGVPVVSDAVKSGALSWPLFLELARVPRAGDRFFTSRETGRTTPGEMARARLALAIGQARFLTPEPAP